MSSWIKDFETEHSETYEQPCHQNLANPKQQRLWRFQIPVVAKFMELYFTWIVLTASSVQEMEQNIHFQ